MKQTIKQNPVIENFVVLISPLLTMVRCNYCDHRLYTSRVQSEEQYWCINPDCSKNDPLR